MVAIVKTTSKIITKLAFPSLVKFSSVSIE